ncbi:BLUF domain-containing protein, partial [Acinetobacter seifertii]|uniref:BLUF domain-containing protein n=1 Tax=Acinetobacter seifertii TaxID=1530123 RepID=UPI00148F19D0
YGNGYFLQYIEGEKELVKSLFYKSIFRDVRHQNCKIIFLESLEHRLFKNWSMRFAPVNLRIKDFFQRYYNVDFNPYLLNSLSIPYFLKIILDRKIL